MRKTKAEAAKTRQGILDAALACFDRHGIAHTTLDQIAAACGVTKGAIYWHFRGKREIFHAIREEVSLPLLDQADTTLLHGGSRPALERVEDFLASILQVLEKDSRKRRALTVMQFKCEYVGDLAGELAGAISAHRKLAKSLEVAYGQAKRKAQLARGLTPRIAALESLLFISGLVRLWLLDRGRDGVRGHARELLQAHMRSQRRS